MNLEILYEDNHLIAVNKPAGILVQGDISEEENLMDKVKKYLKEKYKKEGNVFLGLIHRLDRNVSGIVLFAKTSKGASRLSEQFRNHTVEKIYHAWVEGKPPQQTDTLKHFLVKDENKNKTEVFEKEVVGSQYAELTYEITPHPSLSNTGCWTNKEVTFLKVKLGTGRSHQIRAQLAHIGCPIVGDVKYGASKALSDQSILLSATELRFDTATEPKRVSLVAPLPQLNI